MCVSDHDESEAINVIGKIQFEFSPPEDEDEMVNSSPLAWSYCGASRYLQFARFAESASAMGHYGWLEGDYRYSRIMEPHMRKPGYG